MQVIEYELKSCETLTNDDFGRLFWGNIRMSKQIEAKTDETALISINKIAQIIGFKLVTGTRPT
jgi:hypothetical protein